MFLLIFESIGTSELILIGVVALIFLGPRRMPEMARKIGRMMADFRNTTNEFKSTWEREVNFEDEEKALRLGEIEKEVEQPVPRVNTILNTEPKDEIEAPEIKEIDASGFEKEVSKIPSEDVKPPKDDLNEKQTWL